MKHLGWPYLRLCLNCALARELLLWSTEWRIEMLIVLRTQQIWRLQMARVVLVLNVILMALINLSHVSGTLGNWYKCILRWCYSCSYSKLCTRIWCDTRICIYRHVLDRSTIRSSILLSFTGMAWSYLAYSVSWESYRAFVVISCCIVLLLCWRLTP